MMYFFAGKPCSLEKNHLSTHVPKSQSLGFRFRMHGREKPLLIFVQLIVLFSASEILGNKNRWWLASGVGQNLAHSFYFDV